MSNSRQKYNEALRSILSTRDFKEIMAMILTDDMYFFPAYLELLWFAEEDGNEAHMHRTLEEARQALLSLARSRQTRAKISQDWTDLEHNACRELGGQIISSPYFKLIDKLILLLVHRALLLVCTPQVTQSTKNNIYLKKVKKIDITPLQKEINELPPLWWLVDTERSESISHHQHTEAVVLRARPDKNISYSPTDGMHESVAKSAAQVLPQIHRFVLDFAAEHNLGLGRVAVIRTKPNSHVYRHYDSEPWYEGRKRYHLVLTAGKGSILSSGDETEHAQPGEVWLFDNTVMHRAYNKSPLPRIHVVFDGYPLIDIPQHKEK